MTRRWWKVRVLRFAVWSDVWRWCRDAARSGGYVGLALFFAGRQAVAIARMNDELRRAHKALS